MAKKDEYEINRAHIPDSFLFLNPAKLPKEFSEDAFWDLQPQARELFYMSPSYNTSKESFVFKKIQFLSRLYKDLAGRKISYDDVKVFDSQTYIRENLGSNENDYGKWKRFLSSISTEQKKKMFDEMFHLTKKIPVYMWESYLEQQGTEYQTEMIGISRLLSTSYAYDAADLSSLYLSNLYYTQPLTGRCSAEIMTAAHFFEKVLENLSRKMIKVLGRVIFEEIISHPRPDMVAIYFDNIVEGKDMDTPSEILDSYKERDGSWKSIISLYQELEKVLEKNDLDFHKILKILNDVQHLSHHTGILCRYLTLMNPLVNIVNLVMADRHYLDKSVENIYKKIQRDFIIQLIPELAREKYERFLGIEDIEDSVDISRMINLTITGGSRQKEELGRWNTDYVWIKDQPQPLQDFLGTFRGNDHFFESYAFPSQELYALQLGVEREVNPRFSTDPLIQEYFGKGLGPYERRDVLIAQYKLDIDQVVSLLEEVFISKVNNSLEILEGTSNERGDDGYSVFRLITNYLGEYKENRKKWTHDEKVEEGDIRFELKDTTLKPTGKEVFLHYLSLNDLGIAVVEFNGKVLSYDEFVTVLEMDRIASGIRGHYRVSGD